MFNRRSKRPSWRWQGRSYEWSCRPVPGGVLVAWTGKTLVSCPPLETGLGEYRFSDGSWASTATGEFYCAPGGALVTVTGKAADEACMVHHGSAEGSIRTVAG